MKAAFEWGLQGALALAGKADVLVIVDVLSFSTCVDVATARGAIVLPFPSGDRAAAAEAAKQHGAELAGRRKDRSARYSLSPATVRDIPPGTRLLLPSPNGSQISFSMADKPVLAACLRNADAVARIAVSLAAGGAVAVIAAGERWPDGSLRPAIEDMLGAGAILALLNADLTPEAETARNAFASAAPRLPETIRGSASGRELIEMGFPQDVEMALELNVSECAPVLRDRAFHKS